MATPHSVYTEKPESSLESATPQHSESIEPDNINHLHEKTTSNVLSQPADLATNESVHATVASNPRHDSNVELNAANPHHEGADSTDADLSLPPVDTGKHAWLFLLSAFILNVLVWSTSFDRRTCETSFVLTLSRFPIRLRHLPGVLLLAPAIQGPEKHCHSRYLRFRLHVSLFAVCFWSACVLSYVEKALHPGRSDHHVFIYCTQLIKHESRASDRESGCVLRNWRCFVL
jgi:hypothetical protein